MSGLVPRPLGERIPSLLHAVSCSLPTMRDVVGYETKDPAILNHVCSGYPRFVVHDLIQQMASRWSQRLNLGSDVLWLTASKRVAEELMVYLEPVESTVFEHEGIWGVAHSEDPEVANHAQQFLQHIGGGLSSRQAEDHLTKAGLVEPEPEEFIPVDPHQIIRDTFGPDIGYSQPSSIILANSGMNAFYRAFQAASNFQRTRGRTIWIQLGWLYLDTMAVIEKLGNGQENLRIILAIDNLEILRNVVSECGVQLAGLVTEAPSNPLIQTPNLEIVADVVRSAGGLIIVDPTVASVYNVDVFSHADLVVTSLTKYAAWEGDVIAGAILVPDHCPQADQFRADLTRTTDPLYERDAARLAFQIGRAPGITREIGRQTREVAAFLESHPAVERVFWAEAEDQVANFRKLLRPSGGPGALISINLAIPLESFYDRITLPKGPSFGITTSLLCPFLYLAHYDLVSTDKGRGYLKANGLNPELVRLSIGIEPIDAILASLDEALT
jgi:cystathionine beta-lyase/cystathionine gamma-synthase